jgi:nucleoside-diphosphate-sugar epimerase
MYCAVTGAAGFIGSSLCDALLAEGHHVLGIDAFTPSYPVEVKRANLAGAIDQARFRLVDGDLLQCDLTRVLADSEVVFHHAAQAGVRSSWGNSFDGYAANNIRSTQRLLEACRTVGPRRIVYASSSSVYGNAQSLPVSEDTPTVPVSPYGVSKLTGEHLVTAYAATFGLRAVVLRYFTVYGPRQRPDMAFHKFIRAAVQRTPIELFGDGTQTRDFTYIADIVAVTMAAADKGPDGGVYNVGGGARWMLNDVLRIIEESVGTTMEVRRMPEQAGDVRDTFADTTKARRELAFAPAVSVPDGIRQEVQWLRQVI